MRPPILK